MRLKEEEKWSKIDHLEEFEWPKLA